MTYEPPGLREIVESLVYKPGWQFFLKNRTETDGSGGLAFTVVAITMNSLRPEEDISICHIFLVPAASYNKKNWQGWIRDRLADVENHELNEFIKFEGERIFAPHHSDGEDPYRTWFMSDWETANRKSGDA